MSAPSIDLAQVGTFPRITAVIRADGTSELKVNGAPRNLQPAQDVDGAAGAVLAEVRDLAAQLGRPVRVDAQDPDALRTLIVTADGKVHDATPTAPPARHAPPASAPARPAPARPAPAPAAARPAPAPAPVQPVVPAPIPTLDDLMATRPTTRPAPAEWGARRAIRLLTGGLWKLPPSPAELEHRDLVARVQRSLAGPRTVVVVNPKGGTSKTTDVLSLAADLGEHRGGSVLAWDNNETRGTLGWRAEHTRHDQTAVDLLRDLDRFDGAGRFGDLDNYVRNQGSAQFDVLASHESPVLAASIDADRFAQLHRMLTRYYRVIVVDTGNDVQASNWRAAVEAADQVVIPCPIREDAAQSAAWLIDHMRETGLGDKVASAVTVLQDPDPRVDAGLRGRLRDHFGALTRTVVEVPFERTLVSGTPVVYDARSRATRRAWLQVSAAVVDGL